MNFKIQSSILIAFLLIPLVSASAFGQNPLRDSSQSPTPATPAVQQANYLQEVQPNPRNNLPSTDGMTPEVRAALYNEQLPQGNRTPSPSNQSPTQNHQASAQNHQAFAQTNTANLPRQASSQTGRQVPGPAETLAVNNRNAQEIRPESDPGTMGSLDSVLSKIHSDAQKYKTGSTRESDPIRNDRPPVSDDLSERDPRLESQTHQTHQTLDAVDTLETSKPVPTAGKKSQLKFTELAEKMAYNTLIVLSIGVGFVFVARQWMKQKKSVAGVAKTNDFQVLNTLNISPKSNLMLVQVADERLVVATDPTGIKSVVRLTESFANTFETMQEEPEPQIYPFDGEPTQPTTGATYSLAGIGKKSSKVSKKAEPKESPEEEIQRQMEAALSEHGLKELIMKTIRAES